MTDGRTFEAELVGGDRDGERIPVTPAQRHVAVMPPLRATVYAEPLPHADDVTPWWVRYEWDGTTTPAGRRRFRLAP